MHALEKILAKNSGRASVSPGERARPPRASSLTPLAWATTSLYLNSHWGYYIRRHLANPRGPELMIEKYGDCAA